MATTKSPSASAYSVLLLQKLLNLRDGASPLTLVVDSPQQSGTLVVEEMMLRAKMSGSRVVYVAAYPIGGRRRSPHIDVVVERRDRPLEVLRDDIRIKCQTAQQKTLIVLDSLCRIGRHDPFFVAAFVSSLVSPNASVLGIVHEPGDDLVAAQMARSRRTAGKPPPLRVLAHLATAILRVSPLHYAVATKRAQDRSEAPPRPLGSDDRYNPYAYVQAPYDQGIVLDMELRRRSGRAVVEQFVMVWSATITANLPAKKYLKPWDAGARPCTDITVLKDHPLFAPPEHVLLGHEGLEEPSAAAHDEEPTSTFNLGLTEKQRRDRAGIVLPYFDAQTDVGGGEGGRILYDMGREDDFDDEEDEI